MASILHEARSDPLGAGLVVSGAALIVLMAVYFMPMTDVEMPTFKWPQITKEPPSGPILQPRPPAEWKARAVASDVLTVPGFDVAYWGRPDVSYGKRVTEHADKPVAVVVHYTDDRPILNLVKYQHNGDSDRGGSYGYHIYIDAEGHVAQGAPLSVRTNHIKPKDAPQRKSAAHHLDSSNTIGVSLVGACRSPALSPITYRCSSETISEIQMSAGVAAVTALQALYGIPCGEVYGHGDLQTDRHEFEGTTLSSLVRSNCSAPVALGDKIEILAASPTAAVELERAFASGHRAMLYIHDDRPRVVAKRGQARWQPQDPKRPFAGPAFATAFIARHPEYSVKRTAANAAE
jgi:hypothetical protein